MNHNKERIRWIFQRISGIQLMLCFGVHIWVFFFKLSRPVTLNGLQQIFSRPEWVIFFSVFIALALYHGFTGLWTVLTDHNPSRTYKKVLKIILTAGGAFLVGFSLWNFVILGTL